LIPIHSQDIFRNFKYNFLSRAKSLKADDWSGAMKLLVSLEISERIAEDKVIMHANNHERINIQYLKWLFL
jgi:hypothetical protein